MCFQIDRFIVRLLLFLILTATDAWALDGANPVFITKPAEVDNGWKTFEIITGGDELGARAVEGFVWTTAQHDDWDGLGAYRPPSSDTLRVFVNHEAGPGSTFSRVDLNVRSLKAWISAGIPNNTNINQVEPASNVVEVVSRGWSDVDSDATAPINNPCTGNVWLKDTFGPGFGFADSVYLTGEEVFSTRNGHIWVMDLATRTLYEAPHLGDGSWENATIIDTGRTDTVAILLSEDNGSAATGTAPVVLYVGAKDPNSADLEFVAGDLSATARNSTIRVLYAASTQASKTNDFGGMDNLVWSPDGNIYVNEDDYEGDIWLIDVASCLASYDEGATSPDVMQVYDILDANTVSETSGIIDISEALDYQPGSIFLTTGFSSDLVKNQIVMCVAPSAKLKTAAYTDWALSFPALDTPAKRFAAADPDGLDNATEFALGRLPDTPEAEPPLTLELLASATHSRCLAVGLW